MQLKDKVAIVTGGDTGIGKAIALAFAREGAAVVIDYFGDDAPANTLVDDIEKLGAKAVAFRADVSNPDQVEALIGAAVNAFGGLDILVNNAGILRDAVLEMASVTSMDEVFSVNLRGVLNCSQYAVRLMRRKGAGSIINVASIVGRVGNAGQSVYGASKAGVIGATLGLSKELAARNIRVNAIAPGVIDTKMIESIPSAKRESLIAAIGLGRVGVPGDIAPLCVFLASDDASYITGQVIGVDGGLVM